MYAAVEALVVQARAIAERNARQHDFKLLDTVYSDFMGSNRHVGKQWALPAIMEVDASHPGKEFVYTNKGDLYFANVWRRDGAYGPQVNLKLVNDGFTYISKPGTRRFRHGTSVSDQPGWVKLVASPSDWGSLAPHVPNICNEVVPLYKGIAVWYNKLLRKLDLEFMQARDNSAPDLIIGFEPGKPAYDRQKEAHWFDLPSAAVAR